MKYTPIRRYPSSAFDLSVIAGRREHAASLEKALARFAGPLVESIEVQLTAATVSVNRESDRQNLMQLATQVYPLYFQALQQLAAIKAHPPFPGADQVADQAAKMVNNIMHKLLKTFDQVAEVKNLTVDIDAIQPVMQQLGMEQVPGQMQGALTGIMGGPQGNGAVPPRQ